MEKKILIVASGIDHSRTLSVLHKNNLTQDDVRIIQEDSDEAIELLAGNLRQFPYHDPERFRIEPNAHLRLVINQVMNRATYDRF